MDPDAVRSLAASLLIIEQAKSILMGFTPVLRPSSVSLL